MSITLFVRSYPADFEWLKYSVISMAKHLTGITTKILMVPIGTEIPPEIANFFDYIIESYLYEKIDGYVAQQFDKLDSYQYVDTDYILFSDSDCIYTAPFDVPTLMFHDGFPILGMTPYTQLLGSDGYAWKGITENLLGYTVSHEYMRCFPIIHRTETLQELATIHPRMRDRVTGRAISEFNVIGAYAFEHKHPYHFTEDIPQYPCKQFWSWSGLTPEERVEIERLLS